MFNLIVTCVGSKNYEGPSIRTAHEKLIENGTRNDIELLYSEWKNLQLQHIKNTPHLAPAYTVYKGGMWNASMDAFRKINEHAKLWIMSCGYGFINSEEKISGYKATFKPREEDSLYHKGFFSYMAEDEVKKQWWNLLTKDRIIDTNNPRTIHELVNRSKEDDKFLIAAGSDYYKAIYDDLSKIDTSNNTSKIALVGIQRSFGGFNPKIPTRLEPFIQSYDNFSQLRELLGCSYIQVHPKSAEYLIKQYNKTGKLEYRFP